MNVPTVEEEVQSNRSEAEDGYAEVIAICQELTSKMKQLDAQQGLIKALIVAIFVLLIVVIVK